MLKTANLSSGFRRTRLWIASLAVLLAGSVLADSSGVVAESWGDDTSVARVGRLYIAGQPDLDALKQAKDHGVSLVISLRSSTEYDWDEVGAAESQGLQFQRIPVDGSAAELDGDAMKRISELVLSDPEARVMVHCASGNRAAAWLAVHLAEQELASVDEAVETAAQAGLTKSGLERKVRNYLENRGAQ